MRLKKARRVRLLLFAALSLALATGLMGYALRDGIEYYRTPSQVLSDIPSSSEVFRLGGLVERGSLVRSPGGEIRFRVTDGAASIPVQFAGVPPDLFGEGRGVIARGRIAAGEFMASEILAKHDETYVPRALAGSAPSGQGTR